MNRRTKLGIGIAAGVLVLIGSAIGIAAAVSGDGDGAGAVVSGQVADQARAAAVKAVPGGQAGAVEAEADEGDAAYGVLVTKSDGTKVEVHLDKNFRVLNTQAPDQDTNDNDGDEG